MAVRKSRAARRSASLPGGAIPRSSYMVILVICMVGGSIYQLPYLNTYYLNAMTEVLGYDDGKIGLLVSVYGLFNFILYIPGGFLADRFSYRQLVVIGGMSTAALGLWYTMMPEYVWLLVIHAAMSISSTFIFWAAMIKAVNNQGTREQQGRLFGFQASVTFVFRTLFMFLVATIYYHYENLEQKVTGFRAVLLAYSILVGVCSMLVSAVLKEPGRPKKRSGAQVTLREMAATLKYPNLWLCGAIVFFQYFASALITGFGSKYLVSWFGLTDGIAAYITTGVSFLIIFSSLFAGFTADKLGSRILFCILMLIVMIVTALVLRPIQNLYIYLAVLIVFCFCCYAFKAMYFATLDDIRMPKHLIGSASAIISLVGYMPDTFTTAVIGFQMNRDVSKGYDLVFGLMAAASAVSLLLCLLLQRIVKRADEKDRREAELQARAAGQSWPAATK